MDLVTAFGLFAVTAMLVCYALEERNPIFVLAFAGACGLGSVYGFLQGADVHKEIRRSGWSRLFGLLSRCGGGGCGR